MHKLTLSQLNNQNHTVLELFAGGGGLALGLEQAGLESVALIENNRFAAKTLRKNRPNWNIVEEDIRNIDFKTLKEKVDVLTGGFPCQSFSLAGKKLGLKDKRGNLFFEFARAVKEVQPKLFVGENVKGLLYHNKGKTIRKCITTLEKQGYNVIAPRILKAVNYQVPQKRERVFIVGVRQDIDIDFEFPPIENREPLTLQDALKAGKLYTVDVPESPGYLYTPKKQAVLSLVPQGGNWKDLPIKIQKEYLGKMYNPKRTYSAVAHRLTWHKPCYTLLCSPSSKLIERCHPEETRPLTTGEYARIQTFPDHWKFVGSRDQVYRQIGNAVPVNLAKVIGKSIVSFLNEEKDIASKPVKMVSLNSKNMKKVA